MRPPDTASTVVAYDDAPLRAFHVRVLVGGAGGVFSDGFGLGVVGVALSASASELGLSTLWLGLIGSASLAGLFIGALLTGALADRSGRRPIYSWNMAILAVISALQFFVDSPTQLLAVRLLIGVVLGTDYVVSKAYLTEMSPRRLRGRILSTLAIAWAAGYVAAYIVSYALVDNGASGWRWMLLMGAVPALLVLPLRVRMPESPLWLARRGRSDEAARVVRERIGKNVAAPMPAASPSGLKWRSLLSSEWRRNALVGCTFYTCQVIPYFALGTFLPTVMAALRVDGGYLGGLVYNVFLLLGGVFGWLLIDRLPRRAFLVGSFTITGATMLVLTVAANLPAFAIVILFAVFACTLSAAANLEYVHTPELFPTELRASGVGLAIAASRVGSAASTFLLPGIVVEFGVRVALGGCVVVLFIGAIVCQLWAPETRGLRLASETERDSDPCQVQTIPRI